MVAGCCCCHAEAMSRAEHLKAEEDLLARGIEWFRAIRPTDVSWSVVDVALKNSRGHIHTIEYTCGTPDPDVPALVCIHGFGFGAALYYAAAPVLAERWGGRVFSIDQLGCGLSSRPPWPYAYGHRCPVDKAEAYFVEALEEWRAQLELESICLVAHSIGGYVAAAFAERYPQRLSRLILASPAGVPPPPEGLAEVHKRAPLALRLVRVLFARGWSPFMLAKDFGLGRRMLGNYINRRFDDGQSWIAKPELISYLVGIWCRSPKSAGGYIHSHLLTFGGIPQGSQGEFVYARAPLADRLLALAHQVPRLTCIYGEFDWMYWRNAADVRARQELGAPPIDVWRVAQATHQQMIDNPLGFADAVLATGSIAAGHLPVGAGFGQHYGAQAKLFERASGVKLPQDTDFITVWASEQEAGDGASGVPPLVPVVVYS